MPSGPAMFMKLGWSTPADDQLEDNDSVNPFHDLFLCYDDELIDDRNDVNSTSGDDTDHCTDDEISLSAPPYSPIGDGCNFNGSACASPTNICAAANHDKAYVCTPELPGVHMELPTVSTPLLNTENGSKSGASLIPAVDQFIGSSNTDNGKLNYLACVLLHSSFITICMHLHRSWYISINNYHSVIVKNLYIYL